MLLVIKIEMIVNLERRFHGVSKLYGEDALNLFKESHVAVIGIGGVGSWVVESLARSGIGTITIVDLDHISESNINRQIHAMTSTIGKSKITSMADRIAEINPSCNVICKDDFISQDNINEILTDKYSVIIDCIDQIHAKLAISLFSKINDYPLFICGGAGGKTDFFSLKSGDISLATHDALLSKLRSKIRKSFDFQYYLNKNKNKRKPKIGLCALWFAQPTIYPNICNANFSGGLACAGYGSLVTCTASMGFAAANLALNNIVMNIKKSV
ncbi:family 1 dinucleotide-utilizing molybdopterin and thiamine biosynthesis protein [Candidatus Kinetoplastibacterium desouzaii TCC079E]|uniref:Family 1 dinucleotide-utilizing molybdopterin and thiamine biosynthesis protein n=1 Tax=Candidatus Kinetoplastidibacterium desouzai TCC079E TaxID=1208919 RepID=M1M4G2_9PROT|nr:tRNA threonylcarbamoyladenosine dehydratase [Candidatus Kinetoplastibacterium desouzaii]AGF47100.1 family 1 dinucleotide-utilizing molybdopterin and thiamine biosynthesis protein [Candidatus Kinetoplastibacterium desouzaii TCC079E]